MANRKISELTLTSVIANNSLFETSLVSGNSHVSRRVRFSTLKTNILTNPTVIGTAIIPTANITIGNITTGNIVTCNIITMLNISNDGQIYVNSDDLYVDNITSNQSIYLRINDGGAMENAIRIWGNDTTVIAATGLPLNEPTIRLSQILTFTSTSFDYRVPNDSFAFRSWNYPNAGMFFNITLARYELRNTNAAVVHRFSAASAGTSYQDFYDQAGNIRTRHENTTTDNFIKFGDAADDDIGYINYNHTQNYLLFIVNTLTTLGIGSNGIVNCPYGVRTLQAITNVSNPPTDAELDAIFGTPVAVGNNFMAFVQDNVGSTNVYFCATVNGGWYTILMTIAS